MYSLSKGGVGVVRREGEGNKLECGQYHFI